MNCHLYQGAMRSFFVAAAMAAVAFTSHQLTGAETASLNDQAAYAIGVNYGKSFKQQGVQVDTQEFVAGFKDGIDKKQPKYTQQQVQEASEAFKKDKNSKEFIKLTYVIGFNLGTQFYGQNVDVDSQKIVAGIKDAIAGSPKMTEEQVKQTLTSFSQEIERKQTEKIQMAAQRAKADGEAFLAKNKNADGVKTLPSGLQYKVITEGKGKTPTASSSVTTHYRGTLVDGTEFDSSYKRGEPATFPVNGVIRGWTEALQLMKEGSKWQLYIPSNLAYGERGAGRDIPPNSALIFDIELIKVQ